jgi:hypothetical protein
MGFRYGKFCYGRGLYSRWPDLWQQDPCLAKTWVPVVCPPPIQPCNTPPPPPPVFGPILRKAKPKVAWP